MAGLFNVSSSLTQRDYETRNFANIPVLVIFHLGFVFSGSLVVFRITFFSIQVHPVSDHLFSLCPDMRRGPAQIVWRLL